MDLVLDVQPAAGAAALALVKEQAEVGPFHRRVEVGVGEDDIGLLPPSSRLTRLRLLRAAASMTICPVVYSPVNATLSTSMWPLRAAPAVGPYPGTTFTTPSGMPASWARAATRRAVSGVCSAGFSTTVQPLARAGPHFHACINSGKFQGMIWRRRRPARGGCSRNTSFHRDRFAVNLVGPAGVVAVST